MNPHRKVTILDAAALIYCPRATDTSALLNQYLQQISDMLCQSS